MSVPKKIPKAPSEAEERFLLHWRADGYDERPLREYKFHPRRDWRFDFAWPEKKLAVEIQGLTRAGGAHQRIDQIGRDYAKLNAAQMLGWCVLQFSQADVKAGRALDVTKNAFNGRYSEFQHVPSDAP